MLAPMLKEDGRIIGDFTLANLGPRGYFIAGSGPAEEYHLRWFHRHLPGDGSVEVRALGTAWCGLSIAGPASRDVLQSVTRAEVIGRGVPVPGHPGRWTSAWPPRGGRAHHVHRRPRVRDLVRARVPALPLRPAVGGPGAPHGIRLFGSRALNALRLEKAFGSLDAGVPGPSTDHSRRALIASSPTARRRTSSARQPPLREREHGGALRLRLFVVDAADADVIGGRAGVGTTARSAGGSTSRRIRPCVRRIRRDGLRPQRAGGRRRRLGDRAARRAAVGARMQRTALFSTTTASGCATDLTGGRRHVAAGSDPRPRPLVGRDTPGPFTLRH